MRSWCALALGLICVSGLAVAAPPQRVVSINLCADALLLTLAPPSRIASVSFLAADPAYSPVVDRVGELPLNQGLAEEVLGFRPDLVLAGIYTKRDSVALLRRMGVEVMDLAVPQSVAETREQIIVVAERLGLAERGQALVADMDATLAELAAGRTGPEPVGAVFHPNGFTTGTGSLTHELMERAGIVNLAAKQGMHGWGFLGLEDLIRGRPDILVFGAGGERAPSQASAVPRHPAIRGLPKLTTTTVPEAEWNCAGPWITDALGRLVDARHQWQRTQWVAHGQ